MTLKRRELGERRSAGREGVSLSVLDARAGPISRDAPERINLVRQLGEAGRSGGGIECSEIGPGCRLRRRPDVGPPAGVGLGGTRIGEQHCARRNHEHHDENRGQSLIRPTHTRLTLSRTIRPGNRCRSGCCRSGRRRPPPAAPPSSAPSTIAPAKPARNASGTLPHRSITSGMRTTMKTRWPRVRRAGAVSPAPVNGGYRPRRRPPGFAHQPLDSPLWGRSYCPGEGGQRWRG